MRNYKKELLNGLTALNLKTEFSNSVIAAQFFESVKSQGYKSMQGCMFCNFYVNEFLCKKTLTELKKAKKAIEVYKKNHGFLNEKKNTVLIELELLCETIAFQTFVREQYKDGQTVVDVLKSYVNTKSILEKHYRGTEATASQIGSAMIAMYEQAMDEYTNEAQAVEMSFEKLERLMRIALGSSWVTKLADFIGCSEQTIYKWKDSKVPAYAVYDAQNLVQQQIEELHIIKSLLM